MSTTDGPPDTTPRARYRTERLLGRGSSGSVHLALDLLTRRRVAIKRCGNELREQASREASILAGLRYPGVVELLDAYADPERGAFLTVFRYIEGSDVVSATRGEPLPVVARLFGDILRALGFVHERGLIHRDLKPANLLCTAAEDGLAPTLIDFGLAAGPVAPAEGAAGTLAYLAPEVLEGGTADERSDLYAVGMLLHQVLAGGRLPSEGLSGVDIVRLHTSADLALPPQVSRELPDALGELVRALLRRDPALRPGSAAEVHEVVARALDVPFELETAASLVGRARSTELRLDEAVGQRLAQLPGGSGDLLVRAPPGDRPWLLRTRIDLAARGDVMPARRARRRGRAARSGPARSHGRRRPGDRRGEGAARRAGCGLAGGRALGDLPLGPRPSALRRRPRPRGAGLDRRARAADPRGAGAWRGRGGAPPRRRARVAVSAGDPRLAPHRARVLAAIGARGRRGLRGGPRPHDRRWSRAVESRPGVSAGGHAARAGEGRRAARRSAGRCPRPAGDAGGVDRAAAGGCGSGGGGRTGRDRGVGACPRRSGTRRAR